MPPASPAFAEASAEVPASSFAAVCAAVVVVAVLVFLTLKKRREQREREQKRAEEILKTPLEKFGDQEVEDLAKKYEDKP